MFPSPAPSEFKNSVLLIAEISGYAHFTGMKNMQLIHSREIVLELLDAVILSVELPVRLGRIDGETIILCTEAGKNRDALADDVTVQSVELVRAFTEKQACLIGHADGGCPCRACCKIGDLKLNVLIYAGEDLLQSIAGRLELAGKGLIQTHRLHKLANAPSDGNAIPRKAAGPQTSAPYLRLVFNADLMTDTGPVEVIVCSSEPLEHPRVGSRPLTRLSGIREALRLLRAHRRRKKHTMG